MTAASKDRDALVEAAIGSDYFSAPGVVDDLTRYLGHTRAAAREIGRRHSSSARVVLIGSGGSLACLLTAKYLLESMSKRMVEVIPALELRWRQPAWLGPDTLVVFNSWSGKNADVLDALTYASERGAATAAIVAKPESPLATCCTDRIVYSGRSIYEVPLLAVVDLVSAMDGSPSASWEAAVAELPAALERANEAGRARATGDAAEWAGSDFVYALGAGPFSSLALKLANVLMENVRIGAAYYDAAEFRHGAVEALERIDPCVLILTGSDDSRGLVDRVAGVCATNGARVHVYDAGLFGLSNALLEPMLANVMSQWLVVSMALDRGLTDLDQRVFMGGGRLNPGQWP